MKTALNHILAAFFLFSSIISAYGQDTDSPHVSIDERLNLYELTCRECISLMDSASSGVTVSRQKAVETINRFMAMNKEISSLKDIMTEYQASRFEAISIWFKTRERPLMLDHQSNLERPLRFDVPVLDVPESLPAIGHRVLPVIESKEKMRGMAMISISAPAMAYGVMIGAGGQKWGGYIGLRSSFTRGKYLYTCQKNGLISNGNAFWPSGRTEKSNLECSAGITIRTGKHMDIYAGAGYGKHLLLWEDIDTNMALVKDSSFQGPVIEAGSIISLGRFCLGIGVSTIGLHTVSAQVNAGFRF